MRANLRVWAATAGAALAAGALARQQALEPVEPGTSDVGPLRLSNRILRADLRSPTAFERVYRVPGSANAIGVPVQPGDRGGGEGDRFARISGGVTAVFPRSEYTRGKQGLETRIPAGTVFYIGGLPQPGPGQWMPGRPAAPRPGDVAAAPRPQAPAAATAPSGPLDLRVREDDAAAFVQRIETRRDAPPPPANVLASEQYRRVRMRALLVGAGARRGEE